MTGTKRHRLRFFRVLTGRVVLAVYELEHKRVGADRFVCANLNMCNTDDLLSGVYRLMLFAEAISSAGSPKYVTGGLADGAWLQQ